MFKRILVAYDGSALSKMALKQAVSMVRERPAARMTVLHVVHFPDVLVGGQAFYAIPVAEKDYMESAETLADEVRNIIEGLPNATVEIRQGFPEDTILECADQWGSDLIVMGSRGLSGIKEFLLGSVSHAVVQKAKVPVLVIK